MKVQIKVTVEVDPAEWMNEYGCERDEVREDVKRYFQGQVFDSTAAELPSLKVRVA